jgi:hypothetical protein
MHELMTPLPFPSPFSRRTFLRQTLLTAATAATVARLPRLVAAESNPGTSGNWLDASSRAFLRELAAATLESAKIRPGTARGGMGPNATGLTVISPGGNYPALWTRDFAMSLDCGLVSAAEIRAHLWLIAQCQNGEEERRLESGARIPPFAIVDHINLAGGAVFYPGTYSSGDDQGAPPWGPLPPIDDHFYFIHIAYALWRDTREATFLDETIGGLRLLDRLERAFHSPASDPVTGAAMTDRERRAVGFGFQDSVQLVGAMSFATLLRYRAARQMAELCRVGRRTAAAAGYVRTADTIAAHLVPVFGDPARRDGWLLAATEVGRQPDVWATLFALHLGVLPAAAATRARETVAAAVRAPDHTVEYQGAVRHVPSDRYFRPDQCWEAGGTRANTYQSGAFWHTPTGWLIEALAVTDAKLAREVGERFIRHLRAEDFRRGGQRHAPWECFGLGLADAQNPIYLTSVTLPLAVL